MSPTRIDGTHFSPDTRVFIELLHRHGVRYLIVGGEAVIYYGHSRLTGDVDFFFAGDLENRRRLFDALAEFWEGDVPGLRGSEELAPEGIVVQFGVPPNRIDLIRSIDGVSFDEAWIAREEAVLVSADSAVPMYYIGLDELIKNKEHTPEGPRTWMTWCTCTRRAGARRLPSRIRTARSGRGYSMRSACSGLTNDALRAGR